MDFFDLMIIIDFMSFMSVLLFVWIYLVSAIYPTQNIRELLRLDSAETKTKDFLESEVFLRNTVIQLFSYFFLSIMFLLMCVLDQKQKAVDMQYFTVFFEIFMLISLYFGNVYLKIFAIVAYCARICIIIVWGIMLWYKYDAHIGPKIGLSPNGSDQVALYFVMFITVREITLLPIMIIKQVVNNYQVQDQKIESNRK